VRFVRFWFAGDGTPDANGFVAFSSQHWKLAGHVEFDNWNVMFQVERALILVGGRNAPNPSVDVIANQELRAHVP